MAHEVFIDTSGFYALLVRGDDRHEKATGFMCQAAVQKRRLVTTDYVLDETATLLQARGHVAQVVPFFESVLASRVCRVVWMDADLFQRTKALFLKRLGQQWSFTDCMSFVVMKELRLREALSKDGHFSTAGFIPVLV